MWATQADANRYWKESKGIDPAELAELLQGSHEVCADAAQPVWPLSITDGVTTSTSTLVTSSAAPFSYADIGRLVTGAGIPTDTRIETVLDTGTIELNKPATATATAVALTVSGVPRRYVQAVVMHARDVWTAQQRSDGSSDVVGVGEFVVRARPLSANVLRLLNALPGIA